MNLSVCPPYVRQLCRETCDKLGGDHADAAVAAVAVLGEAGYDCQAGEESMNLDPQMYGPVMLQGYSIIAARALAKVLESGHAHILNEQHFARDIEDPDQRMQELRNLYERAIRQFLDQLFRYAGADFQRAVGMADAQDEEQAADSVRACSQMLGSWLQVANGPIKFTPPQEGSDGEADDGAGQGGGPGDEDPGPTPPGE